MYISQEKKKGCLIVPKPHSTLIIDDVTYPLHVFSDKFLNDPTSLRGVRKYQLTNKLVLIT